MAGKRYFKYGQKELEHLKSKDKKLGEAIDRIGFLKEEIQPDIFKLLVFNIAGQQISTAAHRTVWARFLDMFGEPDAKKLSRKKVETIQKIGTSMRKAEYIKSCAKSVASGEIDLEGLRKKSNDEVIKELSKLKGIGAWTAEMILIFGFERPDVISYGDLGIIRGMEKLYGRKDIDRKVFDRYAKRYRPYETVAGFYLWAISEGALN